jgi:DNA invertase Pin-like site-specific DNA recombinase
MLLDMAAAVTPKDDADRRRRQAEGIQKAKAARIYTSREENVERYHGIAVMVKNGMSWSQAMAASGCSRATVATK